MIEIIICETTAQLRDKANKSLKLLRPEFCEKQLYTTYISRCFL